MESKSMDKGKEKLNALENELVEKLSNMSEVSSLEELCIGTDELVEWIENTNYGKSLEESLKNISEIAKADITSSEKLSRIKEEVKNTRWEILDSNLLPLYEKILTEPNLERNTEHNQEEEGRVDSEEIENKDDFEVPDDFQLDEEFLKELDEDEKRFSLDNIETKKNTSRNLEAAKTKREDSRNRGPKISKGLEEKLGRFDTNGINILINFKRQAEQSMEMSKCSDEMRMAITEKLTGITELLLDVYKITRSHVSNDKKAEKLKSLMEGVEVIGLVAKVGEEIKDVKGRLEAKGKEIAEQVKNDACHEISLFDEVEDHEEEIASEAYSRDDESKEEYTYDEDRSQYDREDLSEHDGRSRSFTYDFDDDDWLDYDDEEELSLVKPEKLGFIGNLKKIMHERKTNPDKKVGFFAAIKEAYIASKFEKEAEIDSVDKLFDVDDDWPEYDDENIYDDEEHQTEESDKKKEIYKDAADAMKNVASKIKEAESPKELTAEFLRKMAQRVAEFSKDEGVFKWSKSVIKDGIEYVDSMFEQTGELVVEKAKKNIAKFIVKDDGMER